MKKLVSIILALAIAMCMTSCSSFVKIGHNTTIPHESNAGTKNIIESITEKIVTAVTETVTDPGPTEAETEPDYSIVNFQSSICQPQGVIRGTADLAISLLKNTLDTPNAVISPVSVAIALTMTGSGAKGDTLAEFRKILGNDITDMQDFVENYVNEINSNPDLGISLANSVWFNGQKGRLSISSRFENLCKDRFHSDIFKEEFAPATADKINKWISGKTDGKIDKVLEEIPEAAVAYLINTVLFESEWVGNYTSRDVVPNSLFTTADGRKQSVTMLKSVEPVNDVYYFKLGKTETLIKDYKNGYKFVAMLPNKGVSIKKALESLDGQAFVNAVTKKNVDENGNFLCGIHPLIVYLPKFEFGCKFTLSETLKAMGMTKSFSSREADFSDMATSSRGNIYINEVYHNTYIRLDEKGTKAAASTAVEMFDECASEPPETAKELRFDRPFIYAVVSPEGIPLFAGTVTDFETK